MAPPQQRGPVPGCGSGCAGRRGRRFLLPPSVPPGRARHRPPPARPRPHLRQRWAVAPPGPLAARPPAPWRRSAGVARWRPCRCRPRCARAWPSWSWSCRRVSGAELGPRAALRGRAWPAARQEGRGWLQRARCRSGLSGRQLGPAAERLWAGPGCAAAGALGRYSGAGSWEPGSGGPARHPRGCTERPRPLRLTPAGGPSGALPNGRLVCSWVLGKDNVISAS